jgi:hypothetical protein
MPRSMNTGSVAYFSSSCTNWSITGSPTTTDSGFHRRSGRKRLWIAPVQVFNCEMRAEMASQQADARMTREVVRHMAGRFDLYLSDIEAARRDLGEAEPAGVHYAPVQPGTRSA